MFNFYKNQKEEEIPEWIEELNHTQERWFDFLEKLETKMEELCTAAIPELKELVNNDSDTFYRVKSGINGQLDNIHKKAYEVFDDKIQNTYSRFCGLLSVNSAYYHSPTEFRSACGDRYNLQFDKKLHYWRNEIQKTGIKDLEIDYKKILEDYETIKNKFSCKQCGYGITIEKIFFINTYIPCPSCETQNTYEPSTQARSLLNIAQGLAEQRTEKLYREYEIEYAKERDLYHKMHKNRVLNKDDKSTSNAKEKQNEIWEAERQASIINAREMYKKYLRAMYDELNKITPDLKEHNEKVYKSQINN